MPKGFIGMEDTVRDEMELPYDWEVFMDRGIGRCIS